MHGHPQSPYSIIVVPMYFMTAPGAQAEENGRICYEYSTISPNTYPRVLRFRFQWKVKDSNDNSIQNTRGQTTPLEWPSRIKVLVD